MPSVVLGRTELRVTRKQEDMLVDMCESHGTVITVNADSTDYWDAELHAAVVKSARDAGITADYFKIDMMDF